MSNNLLCQYYNLFSFFCGFIGNTFYGPRVKVLKEVSLMSEIMSQFPV